MADVNVYTASRLSDLASSLSRLARAFVEDDDNGCLTEEDARMAMETAAAVVCGSCKKCSLSSDFEKESNYYLYYLLRSFEQNGRVEEKDMPRMFVESCPRRETYMVQLNRNLGRATMNCPGKTDFWKAETR